MRNPILNLRIFYSKTIFILFIAEKKITPHRKENNIPRVDMVGLPTILLIC